MAGYEDVIRLLDQWGVWDYVIPFILVFTLVYAILEKTKILGTEKGKPKHRFNAMIAFVLSFLVLISVNVLGAINLVAQYMVVVLVAIMLLSVLFGLFGFKGLRKNIVMAIGLILFGAIALYAFGFLGILNLDSLRRFFETPIIAALIMLLLLWFILRGGESQPQPTPPPGPQPPPYPS